MWKIVNFTHATVDGYVDNSQNWWLPYIDDEVQQTSSRCTWRPMPCSSGASPTKEWPKPGPAMADHPFAGPFVDHVNSITHYVVASQPIDTPVWEPTVVIDGANLLEEVRALKQADGGDILIWGTGQLTDALAAAGLLDEYRISTAPVIKGDGEPLFRAASAAALEHVNTSTYATAAVIHTYRPFAAT